jgi:hypothetical protein
MTIKEVYEKYKHMDRALTDLYSFDTFVHHVAKDLWEAVSAAAQSAPAQATTDTGAMVPCSKHRRGAHCWLMGGPNQCGDLACRLSRHQ